MEQIELKTKTMGIEKFGEFLKTHAPNCYIDVPLSHFRGHRVSVDMDNLNHVMMRISTKIEIGETDMANQDPDQVSIHRRAKEMILTKLEVFFQAGITPVCVFDGIPHPLKQHAKQKKAKNKDKLKTRLETARKQLREGDPFIRNPIVLNEYVTCAKQDVKVSREFVHELKDILRSVGFPVLHADDYPNIMTKDAEGLCATLCLQGNDYCVAGYTTDSDFHVYGGNIQITEIEGRSTKDGIVQYAKVRTLEAILQQSGLSFPQFQDFCIMLETDFNPNIPGIGLVKAWARLKKYGSLDQMALYEDVRILNHLQVRQLFNSTIVRLEFDPNFNMDLFRANSRDVFGVHGLHDHTGRIFHYLEEMFRPKFVVIN